MLLNKFNHSAEAAVVNLLSELNISVKPNDIVEELERHPDYPSMLAISDVIAWFRVDNDAFHIKTDELGEVPLPFIAHTNRNNDFVTVHKISAKKIWLSDNRRKNYAVSADEFDKIFSGVILTARPSPEHQKARGKNVIKGLLNYKFTAALLVLILGFAFLLYAYSPVFSFPDWTIISIAIILTGGLVTSLFLLIQSIDSNNPMVQTFCGGGDGNNCNAILASDAAVVFEGLSWSEVGFFYFSGSLITLFFLADSAFAMHALALFNLLSLPYSIYSIYYQSIVAKQWCVLCTTVQALLWLEFFFLMMNIKTPFGFSWESMALVSLCFLLPVSLWLLLKPFLLKFQKLKTFQQQTRGFKYDRHLFDSALKNQPKYATPDADWSIVIGNTEATTVITMVSNPFCNPCGKTHQLLDTWLERLNDLQLRIVFSTGYNKDEKSIVAQHMMAISRQYDGITLKKALHDWYGQTQKKYDEWSLRYPVVLKDQIISDLEKQKEWCDLANIKFTPTLHLNGYRLPDNYLLQDLKYLLI